MEILWEDDNGRDGRDPAHQRQSSHRKKDEITPTTHRHNPRTSDTYVKNGANIRVIRQNLHRFDLGPASTSVLRDDVHLWMTIPSKPRQCRVREGQGSPNIKLQYSATFPGNTEQELALLESQGPIQENPQDCGNYPTIITFF